MWELRAMVKMRKLRCRNNFSYKVPDLSFGRCSFNFQLAGRWGCWLTRSGRRRWNA